MLYSLVAFVLVNIPLILINLLFTTKSKFVDFIGILIFTGIYGFC